MIRITPITRMSFGLVLLTISVLITANWMGLTPNKHEAYIDARKKVAETLAVQISKLAEKNEVSIIETVLKSLYERNKDITALSLQLTDGKILVESGDASGLWDSALGHTSTPTRVLVPIFSGNNLWGRVAIKFTTLEEDYIFGYAVNPLVLLLVFIGFSGYILYHLFLKRALRYLDPTAVIPDRVRNAMDALAEGVLILDKNERVVLINSSFSEKTEIQQSVLLGNKPAVLPWQFVRQADQDNEYPWSLAIRDSIPQTAIGLSIVTNSGKTRKFMVNSTPILDADGNTQGALTTFDDITRLERRNIQLSTMVEKLKISQKEVQDKNQELAILASQDSLTGCLNRRTFYDILEGALNKALTSNTTISCIMLDIDFFKQVNDNFGHGVGDNVIKRVAAVLKSSLRDGDHVCRYGGEEFCLLLNNSDSNQAHLFSERIRKNVEDLDFSDDPASAKLKVTASLGIADSNHGAKTPAEIINQADYALYGAKESGRNRIVLWSNMITTDDFSSNNEEDSSPNEETLHATQSVNNGKQNNQIYKASGSYEKNRLEDLPGRSAFLDIIDHCINIEQSHGNNAIVLFIDIDNFKRINSALGYDIGDRILQEKCLRLSKMLRTTDKLGSLSKEPGSSSLSHLNGDQFGVLIQDVPTLDQIKAIASRIINSLADPYHIGEHTIYATCSIGISTYQQDNTTAETLLKNAETAMISAKNMSGNSYHFYTGELGIETLEELKLENDLRSALPNNELVIHYQPKVDAKTEMIVGVESLLRWRHPRKGLVLPNVFLNIAERTGIIHEIGIWVFQSACEQAKYWQDQGYGDFTVAVNISATQFLRNDFIEQIRDILQTTGVDPHLLEIEVTEYTMLKNIDKISTIITQLKSLGIGASLDDFGTGYSSLHYIKQFSIDSIKIDISFIHNITTNPDDVAIVSAIIAMAHAMNIQVIAEGVENYEQLKILKELGCDQIQGYIYSRPKPVADVSELLRAKHLSSHTGTKTVPKIKIGQLR